jgi:DNA-binding NtrC family response regulator
MQRLVGTIHRLAHAAGTTRSERHAGAKGLRAGFAENDGNRTRTAAMLGLTRRALFNKIKKYGLEKSRGGTL